MLSSAVMIGLDVSIHYTNVKLTAQTEESALHHHTNKSVTRAPFEGSIYVQLCTQMHVCT